MKYTVALDNGTVGNIDGDTLNGQHAEDFIGEIIDVRLHDENGNPLEVRGTLIEVLEVHEF